MPDTFSSTLARLDAGIADDALTAELGNLVEQVAATGKPARLTVTVTIEPAGASGRSVTVSATHKATPPKAPASGSVFWVGEAGTLHDADPYQQTLSIKGDNS